MNIHETAKERESNKALVCRKTKKNKAKIRAQKYIHFSDMDVFLSG